MALRNIKKLIGLCVTTLLYVSVCVGDDKLITAALSAGETHGMALRSDGTVWAWGTNRSGELGLGFVNQINSPRRITSLTNIVGITAGSSHSLAVANNGLVWAWGNNANGQLGNGSTITTNAPVQVARITNSISVFAGANHSLAILRDGRVMAWGANAGGQLGIGNTIATNQPVAVGTFTNVIMVAPGSNFSLALTSSGEVWSWGTNMQGQLGLGNNSSQVSPVKISTISNIVQIAAGSAHALAKDVYGNIYAWGVNANGQLGNGTLADTNNPQRLLGYGPSSSFGAAKWIAAGFSSSAAVTANGKICYWGSYSNNDTFFGNAVNPVQIGVAVDRSFSTVVQGRNFLLATESDRTSVWAWGQNQFAQWGNDTPQTDYWRYESVNPAFCFAARPMPIVNRISRGDRDNLPYNSFVLPLDLEQGVQLNAEGAEQYCFGTGTPWFMRVQKTTRQHVYKSVATTTNVTRFPIENPVAGYGRDAGGSPLYSGQPYTFGVYAGAFNENTTATNAIRVLVYDRASLTGSTTNVSPVNVFTISLPRRSIASDNIAWSNYVTNGNRVLIETNGLRTSVEFSDALDNFSNVGQNWGVYWQVAVAPKVVLGGYRLTHMATSTNYCYIVEVQGQAEVGANVFAPMVTTNSTTWSYSPMYALSFDSVPQWRVQFLDVPHFEGIPLPPTYTGRRLDELNGMQAVVTNNFWITNNAAYFTNDSSPELRRHPVLDRFVEDMGRNPLALASYVINEIELTDPMGYIEASKRVCDAIEIGGVNRSAAGTFLEGQGSPAEQCALLVYLLRQAGYAAGYVFPTNNNQRLLDTTVSRLWQINVKGVVYHAGVPIITNSLIAANYPWVVANIGTNCVHIFPWMKDTEIVEGRDVYNYMPTNYPKAYQFVKDYAFSKPDLFGTFSPNDPLINVWKQFLTGIINTNQQDRNLSLDSFGVRAFNRRNTYSTWNRMPQPNFLTNQNQLVAVPTLSESSVTYPFLTNMFDRVRVEVFKTDTNVANRIFDTGNWRACDFHNRKLLLYTNGTTSATLWLAPYRSDVTSTNNFTNFETGTNSLSKQIAIATVPADVTILPIRITYQRRVGTLALAGAWFPAQEYLQDSYVATPLKRDLTAIIPSVGRVSSAMLRQHAEDYWRLEQQRSLNPNFTPDIVDDTGTTSMLLVLGYFQKLWADDQFNQRLHKVHGLTWNSWGIAALSKLSGDRMQFKLSMNWFATQVLGNGSMQQGSSDRSMQALDNYLTMVQALGASAEHSIINSMFNDNNPISSVRLLQLAAERNRTNGFAAPMELNIKNYEALGNLSYTGYGATLLKNQDVNFWQRVTNVFGTQVDRDFVRILITPGQVTNATDSFAGMSALIFGKTQDGAILSDNHVVLNGGFSSSLYWGGVPSFSTYQLNYSLQYSPSYGYAMVFNNFSTPQPHYTFTPYDALTLTVSTGATKVAFTPQQVAQGQLVTGSLNLTAGTTTAQAIKTAKNLGWLDRAWAGTKQVASFVADPVHVVSGDFYGDSVDLELAGPLPLQLRRNYQSRTMVDNHFGPGWKLSFTPWLLLMTNAQSQSLIYAAETDGAIIAYRLQSNDVWTVTAENNPALVNFTANGIGSTANLFQNRIQKFTTNGTTYVLTDVAGTKRTYQEMTGFGLNTTTNYLNRIRPYLTRWEDHAGNYHLFYYGTNSNANDFGQLYRVESANGAVLGLKYDVNCRIIEAIADNRHVQYDYDNFGDLVRVTLPDASQWEYEYQHYTFTTNGNTYTDSSHLLVRETKPNGRGLANTYDDLRRVTMQTATVGTNRVFVTNAYFFYTNNCNSLTNDYISGATRVEDVFHNPTIYYYTNNRITKIAEPCGRTLTQDWFEVEESNKTGYYQRSLEIVVDPRGLQKSFLYDTNGNLSRFDLTGNLSGLDSSNEIATTVFTYTNNLLASVSDPATNRQSYFYEDQSDARRVTRVEYSANGVGVATNRFVYTNVSQSLDLGGVNKVCSAYGLRARLVRGDSATNEWIYNGRGFVVQTVNSPRTANDLSNSDPTINTFFSYTPQGNAYEIMVADQKVRMDYDAMGRPKWRDVSDEYGNSLSREAFYYNRNGELEWYDGARSNPEDYIWFNYDGAGRKIHEIRWRSQAKTDGSGVEAEDGDALYAATSLEYDAFGNQTKVVDAQGRYVVLAYDALGQMKRQEFYDVNGTLLATNGFTFSAGGDVVNAYNAIGGLTEKQYTSTGKLKWQRNPDGSTNAWRFYPDGRLKQEVLANGSWWETVYADANRKITKVFKSSSSTTLATNLSEFDSRGNLIRITDAAFNTWTNVYDGLDRLKLTMGPVLSNTNSTPGSPGGGTASVIQQITGYTYDNSGKVLVVTNALGEKTCTTNDALGRPISVAVFDSSNNRVRITTTAYSSDHHSQTVTVGSGPGALVTTTFTDNDNHPVLALNYPSTAVTEYAWQRFDSVGNRLEWRQYSSSGGQTALWASNCWTYDGLNRVRTTTVRDGATTTNSYNALGNLTDQYLPGGITTTSTYTNDGRLLTVKDIISGQTSRAFTNTYYTAGNVWAGQLNTVMDGRGVVSTNFYDDYLRLTTVKTGGPLDEHKMTVNWQYDGRGWLTNLTQTFANTNGGSTSIIRRAWNAYGEILMESVLLDGSTLSGLSQQWDSAGRRTGLIKDAFNTGFKYRADGLMLEAGGAQFGYGDNGLLTVRTNSYRSYTVNSRDGKGRILQAETRVPSQSQPVMTEILAWRNDGQLANYSANRSDFTNICQFNYGDWHQRLTAETFKLSASQAVTNNYVFDGGLPGRLGVITKTDALGSTSNSWSGALDGFQRVTTETNSVIHRTARGTVNGPATLRATLNSKTVSVQHTPTGSNATWSVDMVLTRGTNILYVQADLPSGQWNTNATSTFTVSTTACDKVETLLDTSGNITNRVWKNGSNQVVRTQSLVWDAFGRLVKVFERDSQNNGYNWLAKFDGLGRRIQTLTYQATNTLTLASPASTVQSYYDPQVEFLEIGVSVNGVTSWKTYGPDLDGFYGSQQGLGGLETLSGNASVGAIQDQFGNVVAGVSNGVVLWNASRVTGYGPVEGYVCPALSSAPLSLEHLSWRGKYRDGTGLYYWGARPYDYERRSFLAFDPFGHGATPDGYAAFNGNPTMYFDADGRVASRFATDFQQRLDQKARFDETPGWTHPISAVVGSAQIGLENLNSLLGWSEKHLGIPEGASVFLPLIGQEQAFVRAMASAEIRVSAAAEAPYIRSSGSSLFQGSEFVDDFAILRKEVAAKKPNLNRNDAISKFGLYEIETPAGLEKVGKADLTRVTQSSGLPTRLHQQVRKLEKVYGEGNVKGIVVEDLGETTTAAAKAAENARIKRIINQTGQVPPGNQRSYRP